MRAVPTSDFADCSDKWLDNGKPRCDGLRITGVSCQSQWLTGGADRTEVNVGQVGGIMPLTTRWECCQETTVWQSVQQASLPVVAAERHATDASSASSLGLADCYNKSWEILVPSLLASAPISGVQNRRLPLSFSATDCTRRHGLRRQ